MKAQLIYIYDPLCGWCYGFSPVITRIHEEYKDLLDFDILPGGMVTGKREGPIGDFADYVLTAIPRVEEYSGVKFGEPYKAKLKDKSLYQSSLKPCVATEVFKSFNSGDAITFAADVQKKHYLGGDDLQGDDVYAEAIRAYGIDEKAFLERLNSEEYKANTRKVFTTIQQWGITGFPAVLLVKDGQYYLIAKGYLPYEDLKATIDKIIG